MSIMDSAEKLTYSSSSEIRDYASTFFEFIKEYYMNHPLRGQSPAVMCSLFDEIQFYSLEAEESLDGVSGSSEMSEMIKRSEDAMKSYLLSGTAIKGKSPTKLMQVDMKEAEEYLFLKNRVINLSYGQNTIITIMRSPYLSSKIIVRNLTGIHAWLLNEHQVLGNDFLKTMEYSDRIKVYLNALLLKGDCRLMDIVTGARSASDAAKEEKELKQRLEEITSFEPVDKMPEIEAELARVRKKDGLLQSISLLAEYYPDMKIVLLDC